MTADRTANKSPYTNEHLIDSEVPTARLPNCQPRRWFRRVFANLVDPGILAVSLTSGLSLSRIRRLGSPPVGLPPVGLPPVGFMPFVEVQCRGCDEQLTQKRLQFAAQVVNLISLVVFLYVATDESERHAKNIMIHVGLSTNSPCPRRIISRQTNHFTGQKTRQYGVRASGTNLEASIRRKQFGQPSSLYRDSAGNRLYQPPPWGVEGIAQTANCGSV
jgi:hypothetical protein